MRAVSYAAFLSQQTWHYSWRDDLYGMSIWIANLKSLGES